jgi:peroxiredoxin
MKFLSLLVMIAAIAGAAYGQDEISPIIEREIGYRDWTYQDLGSEGKTTLSKFAEGKKLVMVVYWAPWCWNWKQDVAFVQQMHEKYKDKGLAVIGVGEYDKIDKMRAFVTQYGITYPNVYESDSLAARDTSVHNTHRRAAGDTRKWGSPWYVFLEPATLAKGADVLATKVSLVNGQLFKEDAEKFIVAKLAAGPASEKATRP